MISPWIQTDPPKDGKPIVAIGGIMVRGAFEDDICDDPEAAACLTTKLPFCAAIFWDEKEKEWMHHYGDSLTLRRALDDEVIIHFWQPYPGSLTLSGASAPDSTERSLRV
jgi:hypothetical protein